MYSKFENQIFEFYMISFETEGEIDWATDGSVSMFETKLISLIDTVKIQILEAKILRIFAVIEK